MPASDDPISLPPDQSFRVYKQKGEWTIQLSVAEGGIVLGDNSELGPSTIVNQKGFQVFSESVQLSNSFTVDLVANSICTLATHDLRLVDMSPTTNLSCLSVRAAPGTDNLSDGKPKDTMSMNGQDAGTLSFYVESCSSHVASDLTLAAEGGDGGNTREKGANAGDGGKGGHVQLVVLHQMADTVALCRAFARNKYDSDTTPTLIAQSPIYLDLLAILKVAKAVSRSTSNSSSSAGNDLVALVKPIQVLCDSVTEFSQNFTVEKAKNTVWEVRQALQRQFAADASRLRAKIRVDGGHGGSYLAVSDGSRGSAGKPGATGKVDPSIFLMELDPKLLRTQTIVTVHPEQCEMLYDRAMTYWYFATDSCRRRAIELLLRLLYRLCFLPLQSNDPLYQAYEAQQGFLQAPNSVARLDALKVKAMGQLCVLQAGNVDFYGYTRHWVPRLSWKTYSAVLEDAIKVYTRLERSYIQYHAVFENAKDRNYEVNQAAFVIDSTLRKMEDEKLEAVSSLNNLSRKIISAGVDLDRKHEALISAYRDVEAKVKEEHGLTFTAVINAVMKIAEKPKDIIEDGKQVLQLANDWNNKLLDDSGVAVEKKLVLSKLNHSSITGLNNFTGDLTPAEKDGEFQVDGALPGFLIEKNKLDEVLANYTKGPLGDAGAELKKKFKAFTDAIVARNNDIVAYNALLTVIKNKLGEASKLKDMKVAAQKTTIIGADLQAMTDYMRTIYENARARVMRYLNIGQRALTFKILRAEDLLKMSEGSNFNGNLDQNDVPLSMTSDVLLAIRSNLDDLLLRGQEEAGVSPAQFPGDWETGIGKRRYLSEEEFKSFLQEKKIKLSISPVYPGQDTDSLSTDFRSSANVRVYRVAFYLQGLKPIADLPEDCQPVFMSTITHSGREVIVSTKGIRSDFEHDRLDVKHSFRVGAEGVRRVLDNGEFVRLTHDDEDSIFGAPGPFTTWEVDSLDAEWDRFDLSGVKGGYLQFCGTNYAFRSSG